MINLVSPRKRTSIEENIPLRIAFEKECCGIQHDVYTEIILRRRILHVFWRENSVPDLVFAE
jgi:hypothetical protein